MKIKSDNDGIDLTGAVWRQSTRRGSGEDIVEVAFVGDVIVVRNGLKPDEAQLVFTPGEWDAFVDGAKDGEFDL